MSTRIAFFTAPIWVTDLKKIQIACAIASQPTRGMGIFSNRTAEFQGRQGLQSPDAVLRKLYHDNAVHWIPTITNQVQD